MKQSNKNRLIIVAIILFPVLMLTFWVVMGLTQNTLQRKAAQGSTNDAPAVVK